MYRPGRFNEGEKLPIIVWGNGTCAWPEAYGALLRYVASYGFFIVAANSRWVGDAIALKKALDFVFAANDDSNSPYYQKLDTTKVGAMGHSQGSSGTANLASDSRVKAVILWNGGASATKPFLAVTGDGDIGDPTPSSMRSALDGATVDGAFLFYHMVLQMGDLPGHLTLVTNPRGWWSLRLPGGSTSSTATPRARSTSSAPTANSATAWPSSSSDRRAWNDQSAWSALWQATTLPAPCAAAMLAIRACAAATALLIASSCSSGDVASSRSPVLAPGARPAGSGGGNAGSDSSFGNATMMSGPPGADRRHGRTGGPQLHRHAARTHGAR